MKKIFSIILLAVVCSVSQAQISIPKIDAKSVTSALNSFIKPPAIGDAGAIAGSVADLLTSKLSLPAIVKPKLVEAIGGFLKDKKSILSLADTNPVDYLAKFSPLQKGLFTKLKGIVGAEAFTKMLGLKPAGNNVAGNILNNIFF
jgi:hypothetical protein